MARILWSLFCGLTLAMVAPARAQDLYWDPANTGALGTGNWNLTNNIWGLTAAGPSFGNNWVQGSNAFLQYNTGGQTAIATLTKPISVGQITFSPVFTSVFRVAGGGGSLTMPTNATINLAGDGRSFIDVPILGASTLTVTGGAGGNRNLTLTGNQSFANGLTLTPSTGVLIGDLGTSTLPFLPGTLAGNVSLGNNAVISFQSTSTYNGVVSGDGFLTLNGTTANPTSLTLTASQTHTLGTRIGSHSTLALINNGTSNFGGVPNSDFINVATTATLDLTQHTAGVWTLGNSQKLRVAGDFANSGQIVGNARILGAISPGPNVLPDGGLHRQVGGTLTLVGGATPTTRSTYEWTLYNWNATSPATNTFDQLLGVSGSKLSLTEASSTNQIRFQINDGGLLANFDNSVARSWMVADFSDGNTSNGILGFSPDKFLLDLSTFVHDFGGGTFSFSTDANNNQLFLNYTPVPEPVTIISLSTLSLGLFTFWRRRIADMGAV